jgi:hypothetical protein
LFAPAIRQTALAGQKHCRNDRQCISLKAAMMDGRGGLASKVNFDSKKIFVGDLRPVSSGSCEFGDESKLAFSNHSKRLASWNGSGAMKALLRPCPGGEPGRGKGNEQQISLSRMSSGLQPAAGSASSLCEPSNDGERARSAIKTCLALAKKVLSWCA